MKARFHVKAFSQIFSVGVGFLQKPNLKQSWCSLFFNHDHGKETALDVMTGL